jgi:hypothetical protein
MKSPISNFTEIRPVGPTLIHEDRWTDSRDEAIGRFWLLTQKAPSKKMRNYARQVPGQFRVLTSPSSLQILISVTQLRTGNDRKRAKTLWLPISAVRVTFVAGRRDSITWPKHAQNLPDIIYPTSRILRHPHRTSQVHNGSKGPAPMGPLNTNYEPPLEIRHNESLCRKFDTRCCWSNEMILLLKAVYITERKVFPHTTFGNTRQDQTDPGSKLLDSKYQTSIKWNRDK